MHEDFFFLFYLLYSFQLNRKIVEKEYLISAAKIQLVKIILIKYKIYTPYYNLHHFEEYVVLVPFVVD